MSTMSMKIRQWMPAGAAGKVGLVAAALAGTVALAGWNAMPVVRDAAAFETPHRQQDAGKPSSRKVKATLVGSYAVTGTDPDGAPFTDRRVVDISLAPSGALELDWDNGKIVGVGQVVDNVLVIAYLNKGRTTISVMAINPDGSLSGSWFRRTDRGAKATEVWKKQS
jgi:hypothetical protein